jgi:(1->4)-alpha-D-glucan 1-alpha-D-glucosylmutase
VTLGSTYRLQLNGIGFAGAVTVVPALHRLGVQTAYLSPVMRARSGSTHGYDVVDPNDIDPALGGRPGFGQLLEVLDAHGMQALVDIVPNHMAVSTENPYFADVLRFGPGSRSARYFDIAWDEHDGRIALPILDRSLSEMVAAGDIRLSRDPGSEEGVVRVADWSLPLAPDGVSAAELVGECDPGSPRGRRSLLEVLAAQHYVLVEWSVPAAVNYRRFFDINDLIGVRQEDPEVFEGTHRLVGELAGDPRVAGFRVDHVDGLRDPDQYLHRLRDLVDQRSSSASAIVVEKILAREERLPNWPIDGTTGYETAALIVGLFVDGRGAERMTRATARATGDERNFMVRALDGKRLAARGTFRARLEHIAEDLADVISGGPQDRSRSALLAALTEITVALPVYRTYRQQGGAVTPADATVLDVAGAGARASGLAAPADVDAVLGVLTGPVPAGSAAWRVVGDWQQVSGAVAAKGVEDTALYGAGRPLSSCDVGADPAWPGRGVREFHSVMGDRLIRMPGGLTAVSTHDSKRSNDMRCRLAVLTEAAAAWERTVSELDRCTAIVDRSAASIVDAADRRYLYETVVGAWPVADSPGEAFVDRIRRHLVKAAREAKRHSSWTDPNADYEAAWGRLAEALITGSPERARELVVGAVRSIEQAGATNSLASVVLGCACPGVPDTYQRDERWSLTLVDPDNRVPVDLHAAWLDESDVDPAALLRDWRTGAVKEPVLDGCVRLRRDAPELFADGRYLPIRSSGTHRRHIVAFARERLGEWVVASLPRLVWTLTAAPGTRTGGGFPLGATAWSDDDAIDLPRAAPAQFVDVLTGRTLQAEGSRLSAAAMYDVLPVVLMRAC